MDRVLYITCTLIGILDRWIYNNKIIIIVLIILLQVWLWGKVGNGLYNNINNNSNYFLGLYLPFTLTVAHVFLYIILVVKGFFKILSQVV